MPRDVSLSDSTCWNGGKNGLIAPANGLHIQCQPLRRGHMRPLAVSGGDGHQIVQSRDPQQHRLHAVLGGPEKGVSMVYLEIF